MSKLFVLRACEVKPDISLGTPPAVTDTAAVTATIAATAATDTDTWDPTPMTKEQIAETLAAVDEGLASMFEFLGI